MGDAGEGWVDAEARIQERMEELQQERQKAAAAAAGKPADRSKQVSSFELARRDIERQMQSTTHPARRAQLAAAIADLDRRIAEGK